MRKRWFALGLMTVVLLFVARGCQAPAPPPEMGGPTAEEPAERR